MSFQQPDFSLGARDFSRGWMDTPERDTMHPGATPDARNAWLRSIEADAEGRRATMAKRLGARLIALATMSAGKKVDGAWEFVREAATQALIVCCDGAWYRFDDINAFNAISSATGYTAGNPARVVLFKNQALLHDGAKMQLYDGTTVRAVGFSKPTGVFALGVAAGPGVTGTYTARYTWYDLAHDHESSPTEAATASQAYANQQRTHTKPAGSPPAQVTHWRAYVRREDTSEPYWYRVATVAIGTASVTEAVIDAARRELLPREAQNDPPTMTFAFAVVRDGFLFGFAKDSSDMVVSRQGDIESYDPSEVFPVNKGDGRPCRAALTYGTELIVQKPHRSFRVENDRVPFKPKVIQGSFGSVSQEASLEVRSLLYGWDEVVGPYWTDLVRWEPIADRKLARFLKSSLNRAALTEIRAVHNEAEGVIEWAVPVIGSPRNRVRLVFNYTLGCWYPPQTGLEYACLVQHTTPSGQLGVYAGDYYGRVFELHVGTSDGVPSGSTRRGGVRSATSSTLVCDTTDATTGAVIPAVFSTTGAGLAGLSVTVRSPAGMWQWRRILSNTADAITLDTVNGTAWTNIPDPKWDWCIGGIEWYWDTPNLDGGEPGTKKKALWLQMQQKAASTHHIVEVRARFDSKPGFGGEYPFTTEVSGSAFGSAQFGTSLFGPGALDDIAKRRVERTFLNVALRIEKFWPDEPVEILFYALGADLLVRRKPRGAVR